MSGKYFLIKILLTIILIFLLPFLLVFCLPIYIFRYIISRICKLFRPDLTLILESKSTFAGVDNPYKENPSETFILSFKLAGEISKESLCKTFESLLASETFKHLYLSEYLVKWMGFYFWTSEKEFNLENHIRYVSVHENLNGKLILNNDNNNQIKDAKVNCEQLKFIEEKLLISAFYPKRSPWELNIVKNVQTKNTQEFVQCDTIIFKCHQSLGDFRSFMETFLHEVCEQSKTKTFDGNPQKYLYKSCFLENLIYNIKAPFHLLSQIISNRNTTNNLKENKNFQLKIAECNFIPIKCNHECLQTSHKDTQELLIQLLTAYTQATRNTMLATEFETFYKVSRTFSQSITEQSEKPENNWATVNLPIDVSDHNEQRENNDTMKKSLENQVQNLLKESKLADIRTHALVGGLFPWLVKILTRRLNSQTITLFHGPSEVVYMFGIPVLDISFAKSSSTKSLESKGMNIFATTYNGNIKLKTVASDLFWSTTWENFIDTLERELFLSVMQSRV